MLTNERLTKQIPLRRRHSPFSRRLDGILPLFDFCVTSPHPEQRYQLSLLAVVQTTNFLAQLLARQVLRRVLHRVDGAIVGGIRSR